MKLTTHDSANDLLLAAKVLDLAREFAVANQQRDFDRWADTQGNPLNEKLAQAKREELAALHPADSFIEPALRLLEEVSETIKSLSY